MSQNPWDSKELAGLQKAREGGKGRALGQFGLSQLQYRLETKKYKLFDFEFQLWQLIPPAIGYYAGVAAWKLLAAILDLGVGGPNYGASFGLVGILAGFWVWLRQKNSLGFVKTLAVFMVTAHTSNAIGAAVTSWDWEMALTTLVYVLGIFWGLPVLVEWLADRRGTEQKTVSQSLYLGILIMVGLMMVLATPLGWLIPVDPYAILLGSNGVLGLGAWGGFVVAALWYIGLWHWND